MQMSKKDMNEKRKVPGWVMGVCTGLVCFLLGALYGQFGDILRKAVMICLECIGIG